MDKQREDFEAWVRKYGNYPRRPELKTSDGAYHYLHTESEWRAWQAAQAAQPEPTLTDKEQIAKNTRDLLQQMQAQPERAPLPIESSDEALTAIDAMLKEYNYPANPKNAARAGWRACRLTGIKQGGQHD